MLDEKGRFVIPILSGHIGGANDFARKIASLISAIPVITTASDVNNLPAIDEFAKKHNLEINDMSLAKKFAAELLRFYQNPHADEKNQSKLPKFSVSAYQKDDELVLIPKCLILGLGCKKGKSAACLKEFVIETLSSHKIDTRAVEKLASIDLKKDENAILSLAKDLKVPFDTFSAEELNAIPKKVSHSDFVSKITGTDNVCERSVFAAGADDLIITKISKNGMTIALGIKEIDTEKIKSVFWENIFYLPTAIC